MSHPVVLPTNADIVRYYDQTRMEYQWIWGSHRHLGLHCGLTDIDHRSHDSAVLNTNRVLADAVNVQAEDHVLDAGCGIGGSSIWLAQHRGARVTGINITQSQVDEAKVLVAERGLSEQIDFACLDYTCTGLPAESFDVVWALESFCYAHYKRAFVKEAFRLLKPSGRLVIADAFLSKEDFTSQQLHVVERWQRGWVVPNMISVNQMLSMLEKETFTDAKIVDKTANVVPSSNRMLWLALLCCPLGRLLHGCRLLNQMRWWGLLSGYYQYLARVRGLGIYGLVTAVKPGPAITESTSRRHS
jgi:tocopherol O-methyltransferase